MCKDLLHAFLHCSYRICLRFFFSPKSMSGLCRFRKVTVVHLITACLLLNVTLYLYYHSHLQSKKRTNIHIGDALSDTRVLTDEASMVNKSSVIKAAIRNQTSDKTLKLNSSCDSSRLNTSVCVTEGSDKLLNRTAVVLEEMIKKTEQFVETEEDVFEWENGTRVHALDIYGNAFRDYNSSRQSWCDGCFKNEFVFKLEGRHICDVKNDGETIQLLILITTAYHHALARRVLRNAWLLYANNNRRPEVRYAFLLGKTTSEEMKENIVKENERFNDIIMSEDFIDSYKNLTYKTLMGMQWAVTNCAHSRFVIKTDDDMYVNVPRLVSLIVRYGQFLEHTLLGRCWQPNPVRNTTSKYYASVRSYPSQSYPVICSGTGYVFSMKMAKAIIRISPNIPFFHLEDVYIGLCMDSLKYRRKSMPGFMMRRRRFNPCLYKSSSTITMHAQTPLVVHRIWYSRC